MTLDDLLAGAGGARMNDAERPDEDLVQAIRRSLAQEDWVRGDEQFALLVHRYRGRVFRLAMSVLGPGASAEAEDVTQEVFLRVYRRLDTFRSESRFSTWLYRIAYRRAIDFRRTARLRLPRTTDEILEAWSDQPDGATNPLGQALSRERALSTHSAVHALKEPYRSTLYLHYWLGLGVDEIAALRGVAPGTVKSWLHRARAKVEHLLSEPRGFGRLGLLFQKERQP